MAFFGKLLGSLFISQARACPFCDYGGIDTAAFILSFFGFVALGATCFFFIFFKKGGLKDSHAAGYVVLKAEGISTSAGKEKRK